jgi:hypothetical protein
VKEFRSSTASALMIQIDDDVQASSRWIHTQRLVSAPRWLPELRLMCITRARVQGSPVPYTLFDLEFFPPEGRFDHIPFIEKDSPSISPPT